jgi:hypothetical protein
VKKVLFAVVCAALVVSCASKRAAVVDSTITEAETLLAIAKVNNLAVSAETEALIDKAKKQNDERQTEQAFVLADEAVLRLQRSLLKQEEETLAAENKKAADSLATANESLGIYRQLLQGRKHAPKEQVIH